ncbi:HAUS augmin-like complex subunit 6 N-terminus-domain-containing protein [Syncephalastrum racemosum]|uniref:HAUS augmin-like complex subunit 6 N-terminus-domain-containing protein n=1 Tax=Syncephalastrum racemosum TaxID=13706 RepID=A0A1X2H9B3_SYNRA|nr:HAUS augmin-like complex subunit 6 N-terminus-domain-containing protein [Syncephalastrum racemosum]
MSSINSNKSSSNSTCDANGASTLVTNLLLLGFSVQKHAPHGTSFALDEHIFRHTNNIRPFEATSHFLFDHIDQRKSRIVFQQCWPIKDYGRQSREYRAAAFRWLEELKHAGHLPNHIILRRSYFEDCRGEHIDTIMAALSTYALHCVIRRAMPPGSRFIDLAGPSRYTDTDALREQLETRVATLRAELLRHGATLLSGDAPWMEGARRVLNAGEGSSSGISFNPDIPAMLIDRGYIHQMRDQLQDYLNSLAEKNRSMTQALLTKEKQYHRTFRKKRKYKEIIAELKKYRPEDDDMLPDFVLPPLTLVGHSEEEAIRSVRKQIDERVSAMRRTQQLSPQRPPSSDTSINYEAHMLPIRLESSRLRPRQSISHHHRPEKRTNVRHREQNWDSPVLPQRGLQRSSTPMHNSPVMQPSSRDSIHGEPTSSSLFSAEVSPVSDTYDEYCDRIVNRVMKDFHGERTPSVGLSSSILYSDRSRASNLSHASDLPEEWDASPIQPRPRRDIRAGLVSSGSGSKANNKGRSRSASPDMRRPQERSFLESDCSLHGPYSYMSPSRKIVESGRRRSITSCERREPSPFHWDSPGSSSLAAYQAAISTPTRNIGLLGDESEPSWHDNESFTRAGNTTS